MGIAFDYYHTIIIDRVGLVKQGDNALGSVRPSVSVRSHGI